MTHYLFLLGKPADLQDVDNPDWVPNQNMGYSTGPALKRQADTDRKERLEDRIKRRRIVGSGNDVEVKASCQVY